MRWIQFGVWVLFFIALVTVFVFLIGQNLEPMSVTLFSTEIEPQPKWLILASCVLIGALISSVFFIVSLVILETKNIRLTRNNRKLIRALEKAGLPQKSSNHTESSLDLGPSVTTTTSSAQLLDEESDV